MPHDVLIAIPALTWQMNIALAMWLCQVVGHQIGEWRFHLVVGPEMSPVHFARNNLVGEFLRRPEMTHLWFIDHDMMPEVSALQILDVEADIVSGRCLAGRSGPDGMQLVVTAFEARDQATGCSRTSAGRRPRQSRSSARRPRC
jgi:hypothetical protein